MVREALSPLRTTLILWIAGCFGIGRQCSIQPFAATKKNYMLTVVCRNDDNWIRVYDDISKVVNDILSNGAQLAIVSRNPSRAM
jgi:hypothetical protein